MKKYTSEFFYLPIVGEQVSDFFISDDDIDKIKRLRSKVIESGYYTHMVTWRYSDNSDIVSSPEELSRLFVCMQFYTMIGTISDRLIKELNIKQYHINLLRELYLDYDEDEYSITMGYKRPFGNSCVLGDIKDELIICGEIKDEYDEDDENYSESKYDEVCQTVIEEFSNILIEFIKEFNIPIRGFKKNNSQLFSQDNSSEWIEYFDTKRHSLLSKWNIHPSEKRNNKLNEILN